MKDTKEKAYKERLVASETWWKKALDVQLPYRRKLANLELGRVLDIGCGIGRNLRNLNTLGYPAVGVDHSEYAISEARERGYEAYTTIEFQKRYNSYSCIFDSLLVSHVFEHMSTKDAVDLLKQYLHLLTQTGKIVIITPQEKGFDSDPTHTEFMDFASLNNILAKVNCSVEREYSFPFPRFLGKFFTYNEFLVVGRKI